MYTLMKNKINQLKKVLIHRFLNKTFTREELKSLHEEVNRNEEDFLRSIEDDWNEFSPEKNIDWPEKNWNQLRAKITPVLSEDSTSSFRLQWWMKLAAMLFIAVSVWFIFRSQYVQNPSGDDFPAMITKVNKSSKAKTVVLKDGTKVTLTAHSSLSYYKNFNKKYRVVHLVGEAYFETDEDNARPFIVVSDNITSICRGNEFSISAYKNSDEINVISGNGQIEIAQNDRLNSESNKVAVKSCQRYSFNKNSQQYLIGQITDCEFDEKVRSMKKATPKKIAFL